MQHKCKVTVIDKKCFTDYQEQYLSNPKSGPCPFYKVGSEYLFERYGDEDTFWTLAKGAHCSEAWDCISRYIYTALQGGSIMRNWTNDERMMIACCNDGTRPVIFKIERLDYKVVKIADMVCEHCAASVKTALETIPGTQSVDIRLDKKWAEVFVDKNTCPADEELKIAVEQAGFTVTGVD